MLTKELLEDKVKGLAEEVCEREGFELYDIEYSPNQKALRFFIDKEGGVNLDDCTKFSQAINLLLDIEDPISSAYNLEVSSPGLERKLTQKWHYEKAKDQKIKVILKARTESSKKFGRKNILGTLVEVEDSDFSVEEESQNFKVPYDDVHKAHLIFEG